MSKILKSHIHARALKVEEEETFFPEDFPSSSPLKMIDGCKVKGSLFLEDGVIHCHLEADAVLTLEDSYTMEHFQKKQKLDEEFEILDDENGEGEGFIVSGPSIEIKELVIALYRFSLPSKILHKGSKLPKSGDGYSVLSEEEAKKKAEETTSSPFDKLKDFDFED